MTSHPRKQILLLHGNRQTGQLLLGRMDRFRRRLAKEGFDLISPDAPFPHPEQELLRMWWDRQNDSYEGIHQSIQLLQEIWLGQQFVGMIGFSQGARFVELLLRWHFQNPETSGFSGLQFGIMIAGYDAPLPTNWCLSTNHQQLVQIPTLHVMGLQDELVPPEKSRKAATYFHNPQFLEHEGGHHVPVPSPRVTAYVEFIQNALQQSTTPEETISTLMPDPEIAELQWDELEALQAIFPEEFTLPDGLPQYPITFQIALPQTEEGWWPPHPVALEFTFPPQYPTESMPIINLLHNNNVMEFSSLQKERCMQAMHHACQLEEGMPCVMSCVYAVKELFESGELATATHPGAIGETASDHQNDETHVEGNTENVFLSTCSAERIQACIDEGLEIAEKVLQKAANDIDSNMDKKGGHYRLTLGLVGKPSAGKSTFFNAATGFARQRGDNESSLGGATMAPHPFTTIDANIGYCLVPAPAGSCPEEDYTGDQIIGCTHGRDSQGRRLIPVLLKDVAGLVPGAYKGRGRGNKFLNDLTDAHVLIHILDASGTSDEGGNALGEDFDTGSNGASHPLHDLEWIRKELIEWVYSNVIQKWESIRRKGKTKLSDMFSGYGQTEGVTAAVIGEVESFMTASIGQAYSFDDLSKWDSGDLHRLVSAFLGVRFPVVLALNKMDLPSSKEKIREVQEALPIHGAHIGVPLSANQEMIFVKSTIERVLVRDSHPATLLEANSPPLGVWQCLNEAVFLTNPMLVFPVSDFSTLSPLPGLRKIAIENSSLPSSGMISCLVTAGGKAPTHWNAEDQLYRPAASGISLRDVIVMKPGSTVEDLFFVLKRLGAFGGEFVRAEGIYAIGDSPKQVPKGRMLAKDIRIIKIMTNKKASWQ